jgi:hypothetical protein
LTSHNESTANIRDRLVFYVPSEDDADAKKYIGEGII